MKNLEDSNVLVDYGKGDPLVVGELEEQKGIKLPKEYLCFITQHNGASLIISSFDFYDQVRGMSNSEGLAFMKVENIQETIDDLLEQSTDDPNCEDIFKFYKYFDKKLIPFGDTGGGDKICFDYRNHNQDNPPIVLWCHDNYDDESWNRISFIANTFEEFINMLHKFED